MKEYKAFTIKANGIMRSLISDCGVCEAHTPIPNVQHPEILGIKGLWDTGASGTVITKDIANRLNLKPIGIRKVFHADGESMVNTYMINLILPTGVGFSFVDATEGILSGFDILIGMDIITRGDFSLSNFEGNTIFSFRTPSVESKDFVQEAKSMNDKIFKDKFKNIGRNDKCPCNSGKRYKDCHWRK